VHLVGFIIRICHDAQSFKYQIYFNICLLADSGEEILGLGEDITYFEA